MAHNSKVEHPTLIHMASILMTLLVLTPLTRTEAADFQAGMEAYDRGDFTAALRELRPLVEQGHAEAQALLGVMYAEGNGVPQDDVEAVKWFRKAAEQGVAVAQMGLGAMYLFGTGVQQDDVEAVKWCRKAAEQGLAGAQSLLGIMYSGGMGVPKDSVQAYAWFNIAAAQGFKQAEESKERVAKSMTRGEIARAQKLAREYWEKYVLPFRE